MFNCLSYKRCTKKYVRVLYYFNYLCHDSHTTIVLFFFLASDLRRQIPCKERRKNGPLLIDSFRVTITPKIDQLHTQSSFQ